MTRSSSTQTWRIIFGTPWLLDSKYNRLHLLSTAPLTCRRLSATRFADLYNSSLATPPSAPPCDSSLKQEINYDIVLDAFFLYSLLLDHHKRKQSSAQPDFPPFVLPHDGDQDRRYDIPLEARNIRYANNGRKAWTHACDDCFKLFTRPDGTQGMSKCSRHFFADQC